MQLKKNVTVTDARFTNIDALRGIAAIFVIWMHSSEFFARLPGGVGGAAWPYLLARTIDFGRIGVVLFFAISGFVVLSSLKVRSRGSLRAFAIKRFFRLYPVYWLSIPIGIIAISAVGGEVPSIGTVIVNLSMLQEYLGYASVQGIYWTLHVELLFYVLCSILFVLGVSRNDKVLGLSVIGCACFFILSRITVSFAPTHDSATMHLLGMIALHLSIMLWGALVRIRFERELRSLIAGVVIYGYGLGMAALLLVTIGLAALSILEIDSDYFRLGVAYPLALMFFVIGCFSTAIGNRATVHLGRISYSLYLSHNTVICLLYLLVCAVGMEVSNSSTLLILIFSSIFSSIFVASFMYRFVEYPLISLGSRLATRFTRYIAIGPSY